MESPGSSSMMPNGSGKGVIPPPSAHVSMRHRLVEAAHALGLGSEPNELGDFTTTPRVILMSLLAIFVGGLGAGAAWVLLKLIGIITNIAFYGRWGTNLASPSGNHLGGFVILIPVVGSIIVGYMARYGTEQIRGHGIPEAIEGILIGGSKVLPKVAFWKPISSAIAIGTGGPFGAEGPIIMTGGALGSLVAQFLRLTSAERKTLLVAGAAAGMAAVFGTPVAAVILAIEVLLFEFKPRSLIPVAVASVTAGLLRYFIIGYAPLFHVPVHAVYPGVAGIFSALLCGLLAGLMAIILTVAMYACEDGYRKLPIHWMWWPAIGAVAVGIGGIIQPRALGVGYDEIRFMLNGNLAMGTIVSLLIVKAVIWSISLASGTSGGVIAPVLIIGCALGGVESLFLPHLGVGYWALISMAATLGGIYRSPLTAVVFAVELTHDTNMLL
ncbi:MAG TPA: chloride channel protein, partial [Thermomicrobiaceae bacterium]|nr:chloride channel protein [Thermomicrobiaceae bacterium]